ncbi:MAG: hypothetical protein QXS20_07450 [Candidatus Thorarchaeota archaeon]
MSGVPSGIKKSIMRALYENRLILTAQRDRPEGWKLISGVWSPFYIQLRLVSSYPPVLRMVGEAIAAMLKEEAPEVNRLVGIAFAGIPIATAASIASGIPACHTRKLVGVRSEQEMEQALREYGQHALVEGILEEGDVVCLVDDLVTGLDSKIAARKQVLAEAGKRGIRNIVCDDVAVLLDRQQGAQDAARREGIRLHSVIKFLDEGLPLIRDLMSDAEYESIMTYLTGSKAGQCPVG